VRAVLARCAVEKSFKAGETVFRVGDSGDTFHVIRRGSVQIVIPLSGGGSHHIATFGRGDFFGDMAFLDRGVRSADAIALQDTDVYEISRGAFDECSKQEPRLGSEVFAALARVLAIRLRHTNAELYALVEA
jgi:sulfate permease, SulP family